MKNGKVFGGKKNKRGKKKREALPKGKAAMGKKGKRHGRGGGAGSKRSAVRQPAGAFEGVGGGGSRRTAGGAAAIGPPPAPTAEQNPMSGILAKTLPDLPVRTFRFPPNASPQQVIEIVFNEYMREISDNYSVGTHDNDSRGILSILVSALCLPSHYGDDVRLSALLWWHYHLEMHHPSQNTCEIEPRNVMSQRELLTSFSLEPLTEENSVSFLRLLSKEKDISSLFRALVLILRADLLMFSHWNANHGPTPSSQEASLRRRAITLLTDDDIASIPSSFQIKGCTKQFCLRESCIEIIENSKGRLDDMQVDVKPSVSDTFSIVRHLLTVGGDVCDGCGRSKKELSMECLFQCSRCRLAHYCGVSCQAKAWGCGHSSHCKKFGVFESGDRAVLHGLRNSSDLNGMIVLVEETMGNGDKYKVELVGMKRLLCVKKENLRHLRPASIGNHSRK